MRHGGDKRKRVCLWLSGVALVVAAGGGGGGLAGAVADPPARARGQEGSTVEVTYGAWLLLGTVALVVLVVAVVGRAIRRARDRDEVDESGRPDRGEQ